MFGHNLGILALSDSENTTFTLRVMGGWVDSSPRIFGQFNPLIRVQIRWPFFRQPDLHPIIYSAFFSISIFWEIRFFVDTLVATFSNSSQILDWTLLFFCKFGRYPTNLEIPKRRFNQGILWV